MKIVYVAGPYRGDSSWTVENNIRAAEEWAYMVAEAGHIPICPHTMYRFFNGTLTDEFWLMATQGLLLRCDAALFIPRWKLSAGSVAENNLALHNKMPTWADGDTHVAPSFWLKNLRW